MEIFYWYKIDLEARNPVVTGGSALTVGSFDGPHAGHEALFTSVFDAAQKQSLIPGIITFTRPLPSLKNSASYVGDIASLRQRLSGYEKRGFQFVLLIDFSPDFARMTGDSFLHTLVSRFSMKFIAEGQDFRCGYKGAFGKKEIEECAQRFDFQTAFHSAVLHEGERISSSIIRQRIYSGALTGLEDVLGRAYAVDTDHMPFEKDTDGAIVYDRRRFTQVLPERGVYDVRVNTSLGNLRAQLEAGSKTVRLFGAAFNELPRIRTVEFL
ncbi:MAG: hypothetical protein ACTTKL_10280 [Treponema sp.]